MTTKPEDEFTLAAAGLLQNEVGIRFIAALKGRSERAVRACIDAPPEWLHQTQGTARALMKLVEDIETSKENAAKVIAKIETQQSRPKS